MDRWTRWQRMGIFDDEPDLSELSGGDLDESEIEDQSQETTFQEPQTLTEGQSPFSHPSLQGLSEAEIAERLSVSETTIKAQRRRMDELERIAQSPSQPSFADESVDEIDSRTFFEDPQSSIRKVIESELKKAVQPLMSDLSSRRVQNMYDEVAREFPNFDQHRGAVQEQIRLWGLPDSSLNPEVIRTAFLAKMGEVALSGRDPSPTPRGTNNEATPPRVNPQLRPSSHPPRADEAPAKRQLTEEERRYARIQFRDAKDPEAEYLKWSNDEANINEDGAFILEDVE